MNHAAGAVKNLHVALWVSVLLLLVWSGIAPYDRLTWVLEVTPVIVALIVLPWCYKGFRFTTLVYVLIALHCVVLIVGGRYTYARVPLGF